MVLEIMSTNKNYIHSLFVMCKHFEWYKNDELISQYITRVFEVCTKKCVHYRKINDI